MVYADTHAKTCIYIYIFDVIYMYLHFHVSTLTSLDACIYIYMYLRFCIDMRGCNPYASTSTRIYIYMHLHLHVKGSDAHSMSVNVHWFSLFLFSTFALQSLRCHCCHVATTPRLQGKISPASIQAIPAFHKGFRTD